MDVRAAAFQDRRDQRDLLESQEGQESQERQVFQVTLEGHQASLVNRSHHRLANHVRQARPVLQDHLDHRAILDQMDHLVHQEPTVRLENQVPRDHQDLLENLGHQGHQAILDKMHRTSRLYPESLASQVNLKFSLCLFKFSVCVKLQRIC